MSARALAKAQQSYYQEYAQAQHGARSKTAAFRVLPVQYEPWLRQTFPAYFQNAQGQTVPFAERHHDLWRWVWALRAGQLAPSIIAVWPRGGGKSVTAELAATCMGYFGLRRYGLYISSTQRQADDHVQNTSGMFATLGVERALNQYGVSKGWRINRLRTEDGFTLDAIGMDAAIRGARLDEDRPDVIILDDLDDQDDTPGTIEKKIKTLTRKILPTGASSLVVMGVQNLPNKDGIFAQLVDGKAEFLLDRLVSGPYPALLGVGHAGWWEQAQRADGSTRLRIIAGEPSWAGQDLAACEALLTMMGIRAFLVECQHVRQLSIPGALLTDEVFTRTRVAATATPELVRVGIALDPAATSADTSDEMGMVAGGVGTDGHGYALEDASSCGTPAACAREAIFLYDRLQADVLVAEVNNGGEWIGTVVQLVAAEMHRKGERASPEVNYKMVHASRGKQTRAEPVAALFQTNRVHHAGTFATLEDQWCNWVPGMASPDRMDAEVWLWTELLLSQEAPKRIRAWGR